MSRISIEKIENKDAFSALREDWQKLFAASGGAPFLSFEWLSVWFEFFGADKAPFILKAVRGGETVGILPLYFEEKKIFGMRLKKLSFIGDAPGGADYLDLIARREDRAEILAAIFEFLKNETNFDVLSLEYLADDSETLEFLINEGEKSFRVKNSTISVCPQIDLSAGWEKVLKHSSRAENFRRKLKKLEKTAGFEFRTVCSADEIPDAFERFHLLHERRWTANGGSELIGHPRLAAFQREAVEALAQAGLVRFDELWAEGECRASAYGLHCGKTFYYYNSGYDPDWAKKSVGLVLIGLSVKTAIERGDTVYDFLRGDETYKFDWANQKKELVNLSLSRKTFPAVSYNAVNQVSFNLRNFSKTVLPADFAERLKAWKRTWQRNRQLKEKAEAGA